MNQPPPNILSHEWGWDNIRRDVFQLVAWGYQRKEKEIRQRSLEEDITGLIRKGIIEALDELDDDLLPRFQLYSAHNEDPVDDHGMSGKKRPRVDILIECSGSRPRKRYRLEAKRCARKKYKSKYNIDWYAQGISTFLNGLYAKDSPEGGLLGLMQSDDAKYWKKELSTKLKKDISLSCQSSLSGVDPTPDLPDITVSAHQRSDGSAIALYHVFLDCNP
ncbi:MAG: hypothetical protein ACR2H5_20760 [Ktedonobacteraceae bacterium]